MDSEDRCLTSLEELTLENELLLKTIEEKDKLINELADENQEYRRVNDAYKVAIARWEASNED